MKKILMVIGIVVMGYTACAQGIISQETRDLILSIKNGTYSNANAASNSVYAETVKFLHQFIGLDVRDVLEKNHVKFINLSSKLIRVGGIYYNGWVKEISKLNAGESVVLDPKLFEKFVITSQDNIRIITGLKKRSFNFVWINIGEDGSLDFECV